MLTVTAAGDWLRLTHIQLYFIDVKTFFNVFFKFLSRFFTFFNVLKKIFPNVFNTYALLIQVSTTEWQIQNIRVYLENKQKNI